MDRENFSFHSLTFHFHKKNSHPDHCSGKPHLPPGQALPQATLPIWVSRGSSSCAWPGSCLPASPGSTHQLHPSQAHAALPGIIIWIPPKHIFWNCGAVGKGRGKNREMQAPQAAQSSLLLKGILLPQKEGKFKEPTAKKLVC